MPVYSPSTAWKEVITPGEDERFAGYAQVFAEVQKRKSARYGTGRALHRKQLTAAAGTLEVLDGLPEFARHGLFAFPAVYEAQVRLSNGGLDRAKDSMPDIRGFAFKVLGVKGNSALGGPARSQDFLLINQEQFAFARSDEFVDFVAAASHGNGALLKFVFKRYGIMGGSTRLARMLKTVGRPFSGFATESLFSGVPIACGPYAVRVKLEPSPANGSATPGARNDWAADFRTRLASQSLHWDLKLQAFVSEDLTPIEDASVNWTTPYTTVARLMLPVQDCASPEGIKLAEAAEAGVFDPWQALAAHRPLGDVQRARKVVYFQSQKGRSASFP